MTVLIKCSKQSKKTNEDFFKRKDKELTNLDWAKWAGWFDTDGDFKLAKKNLQIQVRLRLKDKEPVELFANTFETSLSYEEFKTTTPVEKNGKQRNYTAKMYISVLGGEKAVWFIKNIKKYIYQKTFHVKKVCNVKNISYIPYTHELTYDELIKYLSSALQGDGSIYDNGESRKKGYMYLYSSNINYLNYMIKILRKNNIYFGDPSVVRIYVKNNGEKKNMYQIRLMAEQNDLIPLYEKIIPFIEMDRKRINAENTLEWLKSKQ